MSKLIVATIIGIVCMLLPAGCKSPSCIKRYQDPNPYIVHFNKETIIDDTLYLSVTIYNHSDSPNLVFINPHLNVEVMDDSSLKSSWNVEYSDKDHVIPDPGGSGTPALNCRNCIYHYSRSTWYRTLKKGESYTCYKRFGIAGLKKKPEGYSFMLKLDWNIPSYLNAYCPRIWTGSTYAMGKIVK